MKYIITFTIFLISIGIYSQNPPCQPDYYAQTISIPRLIQLPPYSTGMPYDVLLAYIALDSVAHNAQPEQLHEFLARQTYNDTMRTIMKYYYKAVDYDPIKFDLYCHQWANENYIYIPDQIKQYIEEKINEVSPNSLLDQMLLESSYILHVRVTDTLSYVQPGHPWRSKGEIVSTEVIDTIKGEVLPNCNNYNPNMPKINKEDKIQSLPSPCFQFMYVYEWYPGCHVRDINDPLLFNWITPGSEYIIFSQLILICSELDYNHYSIFPQPCESLTYGMYPIVNGIVQDPGDDFGFGQGLTVDEFKIRLRERINEIITYQP